jgi:hypothetical protein
VKYVSETWIDRENRENCETISWRDTVEGRNEKRKEKSNILREKLKVDNMVEELTARRNIWLHNADRMGEGSVCHSRGISGIGYVSVRIGNIGFFVSSPSSSQERS